MFLKFGVVSPTVMLQRVHLFSVDYHSSKPISCDLLLQLGDKRRKYGVTGLYNGGNLKVCHILVVLVVNVLYFTCAHFFKGIRVDFHVIFFCS